MSSSSCLILFLLINVGPFLTHCAIDALHHGHHDPPVVPDHLLDDPDPHHDPNFYPHDDYMDYMVHDQPVDFTSRLSGGGSSKNLVGPPQTPSSEGKNNVKPDTSLNGGGNGRLPLIKGLFPRLPIFDQFTSQQSQEPVVRYGWRLVIKPTPVNNARLLVKRIDESLNLTCTAEYVGPQIQNSTSSTTSNSTSTTNGTGSVQDEIKDNKEKEPDLGPDQVFRLAWHLPIRPQNSKNRVSYQDLQNSKHLIVDHLKESDGGEYECTANAVVDVGGSGGGLGGLLTPLVESVQILVKPKKGSCNEPLILCSSGECIAKRFMCDGKVDCKDRSDESYETCGTNHPCDGKLRCADGRCISPYYCCDRSFDKNCTMLIQSPCCAQLRHILIEQHYRPQPQHYNEMSFLQTTIYTVIGCSMAFMFIITIMVIAICRVHLKRTAQMTRQEQLGGQGGPPFWDVPFNTMNSGRVMPYAATASGLLVTYNINNGVQFMGNRPMNPPPYSESPSLPPREGPPPPYSSIENLVASTTEPDGLPGYSSSLVVGATGETLTNNNNGSPPSPPPGTNNNTPIPTISSREDNNNDLEDSSGGVNQPLLSQHSEGNI